MDGLLRYDVRFSEECGRRDLHRSEFPRRPQNKDRTLTKKLQLTLSCGDYEITRPLIEGLVSPEGIELTILSSSSARDRQWRLARNAECDIVELNACAYFMARERGHPFVALPIFPHRRFRHGFMFINTHKNILKPTDLIGRKIGVESGFQPAAAVWLRGILNDEYNV
jgi:4,5-dihydroxyphthalate decarboxylase